MSINYGCWTVLAVGVSEGGLYYSSYALGFSYFPVRLVGVDRLPRFWT